MKRLLFAAMACLPLYAQAEEAAQTIATQGTKQGTPACQSCHGADGGGMAAGGFPRLAGLSEAYLERQLMNFRSGKRTSPIMQPIVATLSEKEVAQLAAYFAALPAPVITPASSDVALLAKGAAIATTGDWGREIPACFQCHGPGGRGVGADFPAIAGQSSLYVSNQIAAWKNGRRSNDPAGLMKAVADKLSADQVKAVSAFIASQPTTNGTQK
ncbi:MAG TPA: c-type cytochrome [Gallionellaceae bacterium]